MNKSKSIVVASLLIGLTITACNSGYTRRNPGKTYAPDMTYSRAYDAYTENPNFSDSLTSRKPIAGTVAVGHDLPDHLTEADTNAQKAFTICHGSNLDGQGPIYANGKFAAMPANLKDAKYLHRTIGQMYAAIKYGKNAMGSYASQLDIKQRWMIIAYIKKVQAENGGDPFTMGSVAETTPVVETPKEK